MAPSETRGKAYDVIIIGGGISGLYTAWRLANTTNLQILVLEATDRFGGRFQTCEMPGGFPADMGAMRYAPECHRILHQLMNEMEIESSFIYGSAKESGLANGHALPKNKFKCFMRNQYLNTLEEFRKVYSISDEDLPHFFAANQYIFADHREEFALEKSIDGNDARCVDKQSGQLAKDVSIMQYLSNLQNVELLNFGKTSYPPIDFQLAAASGLIKHQMIHASEMRAANNGFEDVIKKMVTELSQFQNVEMKRGEAVESITEDGFTFLVTCAGADNATYECQKVIYACSELGLRNIRLNSSRDRHNKLQRLLNKIKMVPAFKLFLTYKRPWWEDYGMYQGSTLTDLPLTSPVLFGNHGKSESYATLLAALSFNFQSIFEGLDLDENERFVHTAGNVSREMTPSKLLVDYVQKKLKKVMGCPDLPDEPVCAAKVIWGTETKPGMSYYPKVGVDSNQLHWDSLKPFDDADIFITGDTFAAWDKRGFYFGFAEGALLASERILVNHFGLQPYVQELCLENPWPQKLQY